MAQEKLSVRFVVLCGLLALYTVDSRQTVGLYVDTRTPRHL